MEMPSQMSLAELTLAKKRELLAELLHQEANKPQSFPLSFAQQGLWLTYQIAPDSPLYNIGCAITITGPLQKKQLEQSLSELVRRHQALRTRFELQEGYPMQVIEAARAVWLPVVDLTALSATLQATEAQRLSRQEVETPFDLAKGPLMRVRLLRLETEKHLLLFSLHHIIADGWSMGILFQELGALYTAFNANLPSPLPRLAVQYSDFTLWQREWLTNDKMAAQLTYWQQQLANLPRLVLPTDRPRPAKRSLAGMLEPFQLSPEITRQLKALSQDSGVTLFMTLLAGFQVLLARYSGQDDIVVGTPIANRPREELAGLVGVFANMVVLRTDLSDDPSVRELLLRVREVALGAYAHQDIPFERLVEELQPERGLGYNPLFQVMLALQNAPAKPLTLPGLELQLVLSQSETSKFDLSLELWEGPEGLNGMMEYSTDLFNAGTIRRMLNHYRQLLTAMVEQPEQRLSALSMLTADEREQLRAWNATEAAYPQELCLHMLFEQQVAQSPDRVALVFADQQCTYSELNERANQLAHLLQSQGIGPDTPVGICLDRSCDLVIGVLGILKAGGAYVPLNPDYPKERLAFIIQDTHTPLLLTQRRLVERLPEARPPLFVLDNEWAAIEAHQNDNPDISLSAHNLAYVIYTSGSTGTPKGIAMPHAPLANLFNWQYRIAPLPSGARTLQFASLSFDVSAQELFCTLCFGQTLILLSEEQRLDPVKLIALLRQEAVERLFIPVVMLQQLAQTATVADCSSLALREIITAGEQLQITPQVVKFFEQLDHCRLYNHYGPSETHAATAYLLAEDPQDWPALPSIGKPLANVELYVLDKHLQLVPVGIAGELYVGGKGLARGYIARPNLTAERFVPHFVGSSHDQSGSYSATPPGERLYKTGDLVCYLPDGNLQFLGRVDQQVKIRGFRIEPGEIEVILNRHPAVQDAVIQVREDTSGEKRLVAYVVTEQGFLPPAILQLRQYLQQHLPDYMIPAHFVLLDAFPLNSSGKVNLQALPAPAESNIVREDGQQAPRTPVEEQITEIWREVLHLEQVGIHDNFFSLGGHSLLATQVVSRIREIFAVEMPLKILFEAPSIAAQAEYLEQVRQHQQKHDQFGGHAVAPRLIVGGPSGNEPSSIPVLERGDGDIEQLLAMLEQLSPEEAQALLALDSLHPEREAAE